MYDALISIDVLRRFRDMQGQSVRQLSQSDIEMFYKLRHHNLAVAEFPGARLKLTDDALYLLAQDDQRRATEEADRQRKEAQQVLDEQKGRKAAHKDLRHKVGWALVAPLLQHIGSRLLFVVTEVCEFVKGFFHQIPPS